MSNRIHTNNLVKSYRGRTVVSKVSVQVLQGEIVGLLGPNGAGKTTSFYMVVGFIKPDEGQVFFNDTDITSLPMYRRAKMGIGYLPQEASVFRKLSVEDNIMAVLEMTKLSKTARRQKLEELLTEFRLTHVRKNLGGVLSGGERRRTEIARALATNPDFILLDEPFAGIDPIAVEDIQGIVARLKYRNIGILITDHNVNETLSICDRAYLLIEGRIYKHGTAEELAGDDEVKRLYLGRNFELKRKDYLLQEASAGSTPRIGSIIHSLESAIQMAEKMREKEKARNAGGAGLMGHNYYDDNAGPGLDDYNRLMQELSDTVSNFVRISGNTQLAEQARAIAGTGFDDTATLQNLVQQLKMIEAAGPVE